ncbi:MAG: hypothetical protein ACOY0T_27455 [Myxococcota bacterium]
MKLGNLFARKACPIPPPGKRKRPMTIRHWGPLVGFVVPTVVIGYGVVIPRSCIHGINELSIGFGTTVLGACITYLMGVRVALQTDTEQP